MKFTGTFKVALGKEAETDGGCAYPTITGPHGISRVSTVRTDGGGRMTCWTMETHDYRLAKPEVGDSFSFGLPRSKAEGVVLAVEDQESQWLLEIDGTVDGAYNSIQSGNPVGGVIIPDDGLVESTGTDQLISFGEYRRRRVVKDHGSVGKFVDSLLEVNPGKELAELLSETELGWLHEEQEAKKPLSPWHALEALPQRAPAWAY